ncbi:MAG: hypothetical protein M1820_007858 [Bogoriella megaspora]|nr:MAG: hypothetical protein M1820_007858 [Bogoriella megaspora]
MTLTSLFRRFLLLPLLSTVLCQQNFTNPVIFSDFPDNDVFRGPDDAYYYSASSFHISPGAPILKSYDLVNWELVGHSLPTLNFGGGYDFSGPPAYVGGVWASTMRYRASNKKWYWIGCIGFWVTYIFTADDVLGPWEQSAALPGGTCYYDCGLLIDDDDSMYVVYGNTNVSIAQLNPDGLSQNKTQQVFSGPTQYQGIEGNRLYKINGTYYVLDDSPQGITFIWRSSNIWGPWESQILQTNIASPVGGGSGGLIDQGSLVEGPNGQWYFMSNSWIFPAGRVPVLAPITWSDGWPSLVKVNGAWGAEYPFPGTPDVLTNWTGTLYFNGSSLAPEWEWNLNPDTTKFAVGGNALTLSTTTVTDDFYLARNTLTHRTYGPNPVGTVRMDISKMADGDRTGLAAFSYQSAWIEVARSGGAYSLRMITNATLDPSNSFATISNGTVVATAALPASSSQIWLRTMMNTLPTSDRHASFSYSTDGAKFTALGNSFTMSTDLPFFTGYRYAIFNFATSKLGGSVRLLSFDNR